MKSFLADDFLLSTETARRLYEGYARDMPIFDFHCHLDPREIYENRRYDNLTQAWLGQDHYKWRLLRAAGVPERYITGDAEPYEKFERLAAVLPLFIGSPVYEWMHLELKRFFGADVPLCPATARGIYDAAGETLKTLTAREMLKKCGVKYVFTTDDPADTLEYHALLKDEDFGVSVLPTFRPDKAIYIELDTFLPWLGALGAAVGGSIGSLDALLDALDKRMDFFDSLGCVCSDHSLTVLRYIPTERDEAAAIFKKALSQPLCGDEAAKYKSFLLIHLARRYAARRWVMQYHIGAMRNNSSRLFGETGADAGGDSMNDLPFVHPLSALLDALDKTGELPKTVFYNLDPAKNEALAALTASFPSDALAGKLQFGSAWWFNDHREGMRRQLSTLMSVGLISKSVGMLTDSRSFLSFTRHELFRRVLCDTLGSLVEEGLYPNDPQTVGGIVRDVCWNNAAAYFKK